MWKILLGTMIVAIATTFILLALPVFIIGIIAYIVSVKLKHQ